MAHLVELCPVHREVVGLIPSQGTHLGCGLNPWLGRVWRQLIDVSMDVSLSLSL